jgi:hypothetical protein
MIGCFGEPWTYGAGVSAPGGLLPATVAPNHQSGAIFDPDQEFF